MFLVYTEKITPRFTYIFKHIFGRMLNVDVRFTSDQDFFLKYQGAKFIYARNSIGNSPFIRMH